MADRVNFADYIGVPVTDVPQACLQKQGGMKPLMEVSCPLKSSYYLTHYSTSFGKRRNPQPSGGNRKRL